MVQTCDRVYNGELEYVVRKKTGKLHRKIPNSRELSPAQHRNLARTPCCIMFEVFSLLQECFPEDEAGCWCTQSGGTQGGLAWI